ncbi:MAG: hypothetical protein EOP59_12545, partial [Sphingomonadales bacterium]
MAIFRVLGDQLVPEAEFAAKGPELVRHMEAVQSGADPGPGIELESAPFDFAPVDAAPAGGTVTGFTPLKFGSPIT